MKKDFLNTEIFEQYPEYITQVMKSLLNESDEKMRAFGKLLVYYVLRARTLNKKICYDTMIQDITDCISPAISYAGLYNEKDIFEDRIFDKKNLNYSFSNSDYEEACGFPPGFIARVSALAEEHDILTASENRARYTPA